MKGSVLFEISPMWILAVGMLSVIGMITVLRVNAFIALISSAMLVSLMAPGELPDKISRVAVAFGGSAGKIGIVIALAAVIGKCMMDSGAADRVVRTFLGLLGERKASLALMSSGFVLAVPVFFDTVFYLLVPLARSLYRRTGRDFLKYVLAIAAGGAVTHTLVPPTPGPLLMAANLDIEIGMMIMVGAMVALPVALAGLAFAKLANAVTPIPMRELSGEPEPEPLDDHQLPSLVMSLLPVVLPVLMISANTIVKTLADHEATAANDTVVAANIADDADAATTAAPTPLARAAEVTALVGDANLALLVSAAIAMFVLVQQRRLSLTELGHAVEVALMSGGVIILITAAGGAFGDMLKAANIADAITTQFEGRQAAGLMMLILGFGIASVLKVAVGSSTVAMITASSMIAAMGVSAELLGFHPVYLATAIGSGSLVGSWMNDSGFWIFAKMSGLTEVETLKSWSILLVVLGVTGLVVTAALASVIPLVEEAAPSDDQSLPTSNAMFLPEISNSAGSMAVSMNPTEMVLPSFSKSTSPTMSLSTSASAFQPSALRRFAISS